MRTSSHIVQELDERGQLSAKYGLLLEENLKLARQVSFVGNKNIPILRLFRYKEAFSYNFVNYFIDSFKLTSKDFIFDPFAGMGTTLFVSFIRKISSIGLDQLPLARFISETLPQFLFLDKGIMIETFKRIQKKADELDPAENGEAALDVPIIKLSFTPKTLQRLLKLRQAVEKLKEPMRSVFLLLFLSILEEVSFTSKDGQFLRLTTDKQPIDPDDAFYEKVLQAEYDIVQAKWLLNLDGLNPSFMPQVHLADTRDLSGIKFSKKPTAIITSPPYLNRYDYSRSYALELCLGFLKNAQELKNTRHSLLRSHIESRTNGEDQPVHPAIEEILDCLKGKKLNNNRIPVMIMTYFCDMEKAIREWSRVLANHAQVAMVVDNVRFEGEMIPVDLILCDIAERYGFITDKILVTRYKGNSSQQMKKYGKIPVRESVVLWKLYLQKKIQMRGEN